MIEYHPVVKLHRTPFLKEIFNQDSSGNIKDTSLYYQYIIRYFLRDVNAYFKVRTVGNEVIKFVPLRTRKNHNVNDSNPSDIIEDREKTFRKYFDNLVNWKILTKRETTIETGPGSTFEYQITRFGNLLALLIETDFNKNKNTYDSLYSFLESHFNHESYSIDHFCKAYLKKCKDKDIFEIFIDYLRKNVLYQNKSIENENDLFTFMILQRTPDRRLNRNLWKLWLDSFNELDRQYQDLLLYHLKLAIDRIIAESVANHFLYEETLFKTREIFSDVTVEYRCIRCNSNFCFYTSTTVLKYLEKLFCNIKVVKYCIQNESNSSEQQNKVIKCTNCTGKLMTFSTI